MRCLKKYLCIFILFLSFNLVLSAKLQFINNRPEFLLDEKNIITAPKEGLWSVATQWKNDWMSSWVHTDPYELSISGEWTILKGKMVFPEGELWLRDAYRQVRTGLIQCIRRYEWQGTDTLSHISLSARWQVMGENLKPLLPGILYYGNVMGARVNPDIIPVYNSVPGEFAIFEEHRYPMPFAMLENAENKYAVAIHTTPSPVRGAVLTDQWWSMGIEAYKGYSEMVLYSGPIGYNQRRSVAKALQQQPMFYGDTYLNLEPQRIIEKEFFIEVYPINKEGSGFQPAIYTSLDMHQPYDAERFTDFNNIIKSKYRFAQNRWIDTKEAIGFGMYDLRKGKDIVMGWCGQADSPGFALQLLEEDLDDATISSKIQQSMDFLTSYPIRDDGIFSVGYRVSEKKFHGGDHVSCGQAMYNFAKAIETARKSRKYDTRKWETFLKTICDRQATRILDKNWHPNSTAEGFYVAPLAIASELFKNNKYKQAAIKAGEVFAQRHLTMNGCYWGGTLDATCEDKEGAWAAFQGFLELYERFYDQKYLSWAKHAMDVCLSYVVVWDIPLPAGRMADYNFKTTGWTVVSPQNQHIDVYGVLFAPEIYKMGVHLNDERLKKLAPVLFRSCYQLTDPFGSQGEQLQQTNFAQRGDMSNVHKLRGGYSENWTVFWITAHFLNAAARFKEIGVI
ncbi:MAG: hypothetical protein LBQ60_15315 [Bacteroidales bacterium]|jgi:hypothetical protein|nr:hypothetical protein [Bacteroidales bacterium]